MKKILFTLMAICLSIFAFAQTNTFPTSGNVGIGTLSPNTKLKINGIGSFRDGGWGGALEINPSANSQYPAILFGGQGSLNWSSIVWTRSTSGNDGDERVFQMGPRYNGPSDWDFSFSTNPNPGSSSIVKRFTILSGGNIGIGTTSPTEKLSVDGTVLAKKVRVSTVGADWPDFVFTPNFKLRTLNELEAYIKANQHLPEVPSAKEIEENGLDLGKMDATLLQKVEELTLYLIEQNKSLELQAAGHKELKDENSDLKKKNQELKTTLQEVLKRIEKLESDGISPAGRTSGAKTKNN